ncbi:unnamed protein product [Polarella glacialis]|uniref:Uncharacterized protein n=1 Tax=Polarella glacialis TaxID=89957 RepID=A0A813JJ36_POLGL|nr:unnamed protein product [Polarella glacialis]
MHLRNCLLYVLDILLTRVHGLSALLLKPPMALAPSSLVLLKVIFFKIVVICCCLFVLIFTFYTLSDCKVLLRRPRDLLPETSSLSRAAQWQSTGAFCSR